MAVAINVSFCQINVSYGIQYQLQCLLENKNDEEIMEQFDSYDKILRVFHDVVSFFL